MKKLFISLSFAIVVIQSYGQFSPTEDYITSNKGKWTIEIPEVQELVHIIIAISPMGKADENMVQHKTAYYKEVIDHFGKYANHEIVKRINQLLKKGRYAYVKMDACGFNFNEQNRIVKDNTYNQLNWGSENYIEPLIADLEDFSNKTGFGEFYRTNQKYYDGLVEMMKVQMPIEKQWKWLEDRFPGRYDNYRITFSPLVNGSHSTNRFETDNFKQTIMFICGPIESEKWTEKVKEGLMTRVVFTEIDHNYVNPVSDSFIDEINMIFSNRTKWVSGNDSKNYDTPYTVFNEYMTWAVFTLYALDTFDEGDFKTINERVETQMAEWRGFKKFKAFNQKLIKVYRNKKSGQSIVDLYPLVLDWCKNQ